MGSDESEAYPKKHSQQAQTKFKLKMLVLRPTCCYTFVDCELQQKLNSSNLLVQALLIELRSQHEALADQKVSQPMMKFMINLGLLCDELTLAVGPHKLPLGYSPRVGSDEVYPPVGAACLKYQEELSQYMTYEVGGECPMDDVFAQTLMMRGCEPLPRRRCRPKPPANYKEPIPLPQSLWATPSDTSIVWDPYTCKSYKCLIERKNVPGYFDCKDCFDLQGREKTRWMFDNGGLDYEIDQVLKQNLMELSVLDLT
ncbi:hypothetical protein GH714_019808 [Hevea brasiliensis]|uniref:Uncharacterized protein n=1 Tax=Hevea brasiliensis TaxID=3981 RepID=A0A6A6MTW5_HEVBR|nr:hypothetical protein GH714_019808 [Hevea brasiliensis]